MVDGLDVRVVARTRKDDAAERTRTLRPGGMRRHGRLGRRGGQGVPGPRQRRNSGSLPRPRRRCEILRMNKVPLVSALLLGVAAGALVAPLCLYAAPVVRTIPGRLLTIDVADDTSFQVRDRRVPDSALFEPSWCAPGTTGDTGTLVRVGGTLFGPD